MARLDPWPRASWTAEQRRVGEKIEAQRGSIERGPLATILRVPELAESVGDMVELFSGETRLPKKLKEFVMLVVARQHDAQYMWFAHERHARAAGLDDAVIEALRAGKRPDFAHDDEALIHDMTLDLIDNRRLSDALYGRAVSTWGEEGAIEAITLIGFYVAVALVIRGLEVEAPGENPLPV